MASGVLLAAIGIIVILLAALCREHPMPLSLS
jgi:hypothetical protein